MAKTIKTALDIVKYSLGSPGEIELAIDLNRAKDYKASFYLLQVKPMMGNVQDYHINMDEINKDEIVLYAEKGMGNGIIKNISDIIYVDRNTFDKSQTIEMASEVEEINNRMIQEGRQYVLIGPGRWGSADHWLGIPVQWSDISGVAGIVEVRNDTIKADASQGTHFFQNITSLGIPYLTLNEDSGNGGVQASERSKDFLDWEWLEAQHLEHKGKYIHHVRTAEPFVLKCDGTRSESVLYDAAVTCKKSCKIEGTKVWTPNSILGGEC